MADRTTLGINPTGKAFFDRADEIARNRGFIDPLERAIFVSGFLAGALAAAWPFLDEAPRSDLIRTFELGHLLAKPPTRPQ